MISIYGYGYLFIHHSWKTSNFKSTYKKLIFIKVDEFEEILVSNYHDSKIETINLIPHYMIDIIYKTVKPSHLEKSKMIQRDLA